MQGVYPGDEITSQESLVKKWKYSKQTAQPEIAAHKSSDAELVFTPLVQLRSYRCVEIAFINIRSYTARLLDASCMRGIMSWLSIHYAVVYLLMPVIIIIIIIIIISTEVK